MMKLKKMYLCKKVSMNKTNGFFPFVGIHSEKKGEKMKKLFICIVLFIIPFTASFAQNLYDALMESIEANNSTLKALRAQAETQKLANYTGIYLPNPEVEFNYLWGNPAAIGNRTDFSISQTFDFPSAYSYREHIAELQSANAELAYKSERMSILLSAKKTVIELVYRNARMKELLFRLQNAERISETTQTKLDKGDANILEYNKSRLNLTAIQAEITGLNAERTALLSELRRLNGGEAIDISEDEFSPSTLPADFESWYADMEQINPVLQYVKGEIAVSREQLKLSRSLTLPKFKTGYMSEKIVGEHFQGITVGVTIPLWENKNRLKQARSQIKTSETVLEDQKIQFYNRLQSQYLKASVLQKNASHLRQSTVENRNDALLKKALDAGEISLLTYLMEIGYYYDALEKVLATERDYELAVAELNAIAM